MNANKIIEALRYCAKRTEDMEPYCDGCPYADEGNHMSGELCPVLNDAADALEMLAQRTEAFEEMACGK